MVGISIYNNSIKGLIDVIMADSILFAEKQLNFHDLSNDMIITSGRLNIKNYNELRNKYPDVEYVITIFEHDPEIKQDHYRETKLVNVHATGAHPAKQEKEEYVYHRTTMKVGCEIMLFNLVNNQLIAKAEKVFEETRTKKSYPVFPSHTLFGTLEVLFRDGSKEKYPYIEAVNSSKAKLYFYFFLKHINYGRKYDFEYLKYNFTKS